MRSMRYLVAPMAVALALAAGARPAAQQKFDLAQLLADGKLRVVNREATKSDERNGVHLDAREGNGVAWVTGTDFRTGTIELDIKGRDLFQQSFVGVAFHGKSDKEYEAVYLRPFNFRAEDPIRKQHAVQYISVPEYDWPRLRKEFPEEFENPVDQSIVPTDWVRVRIVVEPKTVRIFVGPGQAAALEVRKLGQLDGGMIGLWTGNGSNGHFANLVVTPAK